VKFDQLTAYIVIETRTDERKKLTFMRKKKIQTAIITCMMLLLLLGSINGCAAETGQLIETEESEAVAEAVEEAEPTEQIEATEQAEEVGQVEKIAKLEEPGVSDIDFGELDVPENMLAFYLVLNNKRPFVSADIGCQEFYWDEYFWCESDPRKYDKRDYFRIVDLDGDGEMEIVIDIIFPWVVEVMDYQEGTVYGYQFPGRGMSPIMKNGVFLGSSGASSNGYFRFTEFDRESYTRETLTYAKDNSYEVDGKEVTLEEYCAYVESIKDDEVKSYDYTDKWLENILLKELSGTDRALVKAAPVEEMKVEFPCTPEELEPYREVLTGQKEFTLIADGAEPYVIEDDLLKNITSGEEEVILYFSMVDMDQDEMPEVVLIYNYHTVILHAIGDSVYGYDFQYENRDEGVGAIAPDGSFIMDEYCETYGRITYFDEYGCGRENVSYSSAAENERVRYYTFSPENLRKAYGE
jgi:hypothetical protein